MLRQKKKMFWRWGGWKLSSSGRHVLSVSGQGYARGKHSGLAPFPALGPCAFIRGFILRAFSSSIVTQGLSKGFIPLACAKHAGWQSWSSSQILKPSPNALSLSLFPCLHFIFQLPQHPLLCSLSSPVSFHLHSLLCSSLNASISPPLWVWVWSAVVL